MTDTPDDPIASSDLSEDFKAALRAVIEHSEAIKPGMERRMRRRLSYKLQQLVQEAADLSVETHWWEMTLDLWNKAARQAGESGTAFLEASARLAPLMRQRLGPYTDVALREVTEDTLMGVCLLSETLTPPQQYMLMPNVYSMAYAQLRKNAWFRAIYAGKAPVGLVLMVDDDEKREYFLWQFMIAEPFQGRGYGAQAMQRIIEYVRARSVPAEIVLSCHEGEGSPEGFYHKLGFERTGEAEGDELGMVLKVS